MTLHEAIIQVLKESKNSSLTINEIAEILNKKKLYVKKDNSAITAFQIHGRTSKYKDIFSRNGKNVSLRNNLLISQNTIIKKNIQRIEHIKISSKNFLLLEKILLNEKNFKTCEKSENLIPNKAGIYCIRIKEPNKLPKIFLDELKTRNHNIVYFGIASQSLSRRFFNQELRAKGHGTFFRSIGAVLNFTPLKGSLKEKANKRNYRFSESDEKKIINWIDENLLINWIEIDENLEQFETDLILRHKPILNIAKNPNSISELSALRAKCVQIANE